MKKSDLKTGMRVEFKERGFAIALQATPETLLINKRGDVGNITEELLSDTFDDGYDVVRVYKNPMHSSAILDLDKKGELIWEREEEIPMPDIEDGEIYYLQTQREWLFRAKKGGKLTDKYSCYSLDEKTEWFDSVAVTSDDAVKTIIPATPKQCAKLVKREIKNGFYWNGKNLIKIK